MKNIKKEANLKIKNKIIKDKINTLNRKYWINII